MGFCIIPCLRRSVLILAACVLAQGAWAAGWIPVPPPKEVKTPGTVLLAASRDYALPGGMPIRALFDYPVRDPHILAAPDGYFYMVATASAKSLPASIKSRPDADFWHYNDGIPLWRSKDLVSWETMGYVWRLDDDATWAKDYKLSPHTKREDGAKLRAVWAPEIHYIKGTYWIPYSMNYNGTGLLKSVSGKPEGPYEDVKKDGPISSAIDVSLFEDDDGSVFYLDAGYNIAKLKPDMTGVAEPIRTMTFSPSPPWAEGINLKKINGRYVWTSAANTETLMGGRPVRTYDCFSATSTSPYGPYENRYRAITYAGHNDLFQDTQGNWWSTLFHPQPALRWNFSPGLIPVSIDSNGLITVKRTYARPRWKYSTTEPEATWLAENYNDAAWKNGEAGFGDPVIVDSGPMADVGTTWTGGALWMRKLFTLDAVPKRPALFLRHTGPAEVWVNGKSVYRSEVSLEDYATSPISEAKLKAGVNVIALRTQAGVNNPYVDIGVIDLP